MHPTAARSEVAKLAKQDTAKAAALARKIRDPWFKAQALAYAARFAPDAQLLKLCEESLAASRTCDDAYRRTASSAWALRALVERGATAQAETEALAEIAALSSVEPSASRSFAAFNLFQATFDLGPKVRGLLLRELERENEAGFHWRNQRSLVDALSMLSGCDADLAAAAIERIKDDKLRRRALKATEEHRRVKPRDYF